MLSGVFVPHMFRGVLVFSLPRRARVSPHLTPPLLLLPLLLGFLGSVAPASHPRLPHSLTPPLFLLPFLLLPPSPSAQHSTSHTYTYTHTHTSTHNTQHSPAQHSTAHRSTAQHSRPQHRTAPHSTPQHSTAHTAQHSTAQYSTAQHTQQTHTQVCGHVSGPSRRGTVSTPGGGHILHTVRGCAGGGF